MCTSLDVSHYTGACCTQVCKATGLVLIKDVTGHGMAVVEPSALTESWSLRPCRCPPTEPPFCVSRLPWGDLHGRPKKMASHSLQMQPAHSTSPTFPRNTHFETLSPASHRSYPLLRRALRTNSGLEPRNSSKAKQKRHLCAHPVGILGRMLLPDDLPYWLPFWPKVVLNQDLQHQPPHLDKAKAKAVAKGARPGLRMILPAARDEH